MLAHLHATPAHALPRVSPRVRTHAQVRSRAPGQLWPRASGCKTASRKNSLLSCLNSRVRCAPAQTVPRETAPFLVASMSGATDYNYFRTYQPNQGRYTQADPIGLNAGWNRFGYVEANPLSYIDPEGLQGMRGGDNFTPLPVNPFFDRMTRMTDGGGGSVRPPSFTPLGAGRQGAMNEAKRMNGIPTSQQPICVRPNTDRRGNEQPGRQYDYDISRSGGGTTRVTIRDDAGGHNHGPGNSQNRGPHFNDPSGRHFDY